MGKFDKRRKIFQADQKFLKAFPYYQGMFMSDEDFQKQVILYVYQHGQTFDERQFGETIYKNYVGFAKGIPVQKLSAVAKKIINGEQLQSSDRSDMRAYGKNYVPQYVRSIYHDKELYKNYKERYEKYALLCQEVMDGIETAFRSLELPIHTKMALEVEALKLRGISKVENVKNNLKKLLGLNTYWTIFGKEEGTVQLELF